MRKCVWTTTAVAVFAVAGVYLAAQHAARHPDSNLGCFMRGLVAWVPVFGSGTQAVVNSPSAPRVECNPAPAECPVEAFEPIVVERPILEEEESRLLDGHFQSGPPGHATSEVGEHLAPARVNGIISPSGGAEESDEPPPFMPLCPEDEPDGVRRMPYADHDDEAGSNGLDLDFTFASGVLSFRVTTPCGTVQFNTRLWFSPESKAPPVGGAGIEPCEESETMPRFHVHPHHYDPHYPSCPYTGGRCPVPSYRIVSPMPPAPPTPPQKPRN